MAAPVGPSDRAQAALSGVLGDGTRYDFCPLNIPKWSRNDNGDEFSSAINTNEFLASQGPGALRGFVRQLPLQQWIRLSYVAEGDSGRLEGFAQPFLRAIEPNGFFDGADSFFNCTLFPVVYKRSRAVQGQRGARQNTVFVAPFMCVYSSFPISEADGDQALQQGTSSFVQAARMGVGRSYTSHTTAAPNSTTVNVDVGLLRDDNADRAIIGALENCRPAQGSFITFVPLITDEQFARRLTDMNLDDAEQHEIYAVAGPSMGLAVYAAVMGAPPLLYTGYNSYIMPNTRIASSKDFARAEQGALNPGAMSITRFSHDSYALPKVFLGADFVDNVAEVPLKTLYALAVGYPIVIPYNSAMGHPIWQIMAATDRASIHAQLAASDLFYTMSSVIDGVSVRPEINPILVAPTITEAVMLANIAWISMMYWHSTLPQVISQVRDSATGAYARYAKHKQAKQQESRARAKIAKKNPAAATTRRTREAEELKAKREQKINTKYADAVKRIKFLEEEAMKRLQDPNYRPPPRQMSVKKSVMKALMPEVIERRFARDEAIKNRRFTAAQARAEARARARAEEQGKEYVPAAPKQTPRAVAARTGGTVFVPERDLGGLLRRNQGLRADAAPIRTAAASVAPGRPSAQSELKQD